MTSFKKRINPLLFSFYLTAFSLPLYAQQDSMQVHLEDIVIAENRLELPFSALSRSITIITSKDIRLMPVISVAELLNYVSGVDVRQRGAHGVQADISIRGGTFDQSLVLLNGIKLNDPQTGHHSLNLPVDIQQIERIEILKGAGARIYGQNAFAGAINIVTKKSTSPGLQASLRAGSYQLGGISLNATLPGKKVNNMFSFSKDFSEGYRHNTDYDITNFFYQGEMSRREGSYRLLAGYTERRFGANGFYANPNFAEQYEEIQTSLVALDYQTQVERWLIKPRIYWRRNQDLYLFVRNNPSIYRNMHIGNTTGAEFNASHSNSWGITGAGLEAAQVQLSSNNLGQHQRTVLSAFLEHRFSFFDNRLDLTPGLSFNYFSDFGTRIFPGMDAGWNITQKWKVFVNAGNTYRVPTFTDLYYSDPANAGNPDLEPESAFSWESGIKYQSAKLQIEASWFSRMGRDLIDWTRDADTLKWQPRNFQNLDMSGLDCSMQYYFTTKSPLRSIRLGYTLIEADLLESEYTLSRYALNHLRHQFTGGISLGQGPLSLNIQGRYNERIALEDFTLFDVRLAYKHQTFTLFAEATNLTDEKYTGANLVPMPGRWIRGGLSYNLL